MLTIMKLLTLVSIMSVACALSSYSGPDKKADDVFRSYNFPSYDQATHLCGKNVLANVAEIRWDAFSSRRSVKEVSTSYEEKLGKEGFQREGDTRRWKFPINSDKPERIIEIMPAGARGPYQECGESPSPPPKSIIMVSRITRKK